MNSPIEGYDERQLSLRHKFGYQAFFLLLGMTALNAYICNVFYVWGDQAVMSLSLILISTYYFGIRTISSGAYTGDKKSEKRAAVSLPFVCGFHVVFLLWMLPLVNRGHIAFIEDGKAALPFISLLSSFIIIPFTIVYYVKRSRDKKEERS
ncbi:MAG: hypothetical protein LBH95_04225 [Oscillospiraceae bacterium]|jgi:hypothetical protein|nr:hypothetical protein [Oscillospiraceae bacterium]